MPDPITPEDIARLLGYLSRAIWHLDEQEFIRAAVPRLLDRVEALEASIREHDARALGCKVENLDEALARLKKEHDLHA